jgi:2-keto-4-pentenoate hydratase/2-oxohepta-3-ene-1,7-dioic acid hydratase in catechol pathway
MVAFKLGTFVAGAKPFAGLVLDGTVIDLGAAAFADAKPGHGFGPIGSLHDLLDDWDRAFDMLQAFAALSAADPDRVRGAAHRLDAIRALAPVQRPSKMLYAAANYRAHVEGMRRTFRKEGLPDIDPAKDYKPEKGQSEPYLFAKANSCLSSPDADIILPVGMERIDWEAELAVVIGRTGKNIPAERSMEHVAGFMTTNDVSCRDRTFRSDRPSIRSDWLGGKSWDSFAPMGPFLVPRAFVPDHTDLRIWCAVNGDTKQDGNSGDMVFSTEDQIEYASRMLTLLPGDIFATGTPAGTGQERLQFLKPGDIVETEVADFGRMRNRVVAGSAEYTSGPTRD